MELNDNLKKLLDKRLESYENNPEKLFGWEEFYQQLLNQKSSGCFIA